MGINVIIPVTWPGLIAVIMTANSLKGFLRNLKPANNLFLEPRIGWVAKRLTFLGTFLDIKSSYDNVGKIALESWCPVRSRLSIGTWYRIIFWL